MNVEMVRAFKEKIGRGPVFGPFSKTSDPGVIETLGHGGFDYVILDMEHGPNSLETVQNLVRGAEIAGILPIVRVPAGDPEQISKALDIGAGGVQVPQVNSPEGVEQAVAAAKFSPEGERGVCRFVRAAGYSSTGKEAYFSRANEAVVVIQLEGQAALDNLDAILDTKGIDIIFVGPYDLSQSLGVPGQIEHELVVEKTKQIVEACLVRGIAVGNFTETQQQAAFWMKQGLRYMSFWVDMAILYNSIKSLISELHQSAENA